MKNCQLFMGLSFLWVVRNNEMYVHTDGCVWMHMQPKTNTTERTIITHLEMQEQRTGRPAVPAFHFVDRVLSA